MVRSWLLAIPHYLVVGFFIGGGGGRLVALLVLFARVTLLGRGKYPQGIFDAVLGMDRWAIRVF